MRTASQLDFSNQRFSASEWPKGALEQMSPKPIQALFELRNSLPQGCAIHPSPLLGAHVRKQGTSRHSIDNGRRLSDATDFFVKREYALLVWQELIRHPEVNGVGIYQHSFYNGSVDGYTMFHLDTRPTDSFAMWVGARNNKDESFIYYSIKNNPERFFAAFNSDGLWK